MDQSKGNGGERLALLIDAENIGDPGYAASIVAKARTLGTVAVARAYGDFKRHKRWVARNAELNIAQIDVTAVVKGKDAADFKMIVEAMDMIHTRQLDGFCIASNDGDFTALAERIRASALTLYVFANKDAAEGYTKLAHRVFDIVALRDAAKIAAKPTRAANQPASAPRPTQQQKPASQSQKPAPPTKPVPPKAKAGPAARPIAGKEPIPTEKVLAAIDKAAQADGWARAQDVGNALTADGVRVKTHAGSVITLLKNTNGVKLEKRGTENWARRA